MFASYGARRRRLQTPRNVCMLIAFAVMMLSPIVTNAAAADQIDAQRELMAQATEVPPEVTEEPIEVTEEPIEVTEEPVVTEEPQGELLGSIEIDYWECPAGYDTANPDLDNLFQDCTGVDGIPFSVNTSDGGSGSQQTGEFGDSHVSFTELPTGMTTVTQNQPKGPIGVFCNGIVQHGGPETGLMSVPVNNGSIQWDVLDDEIAFCSWITVPEQAPADLTVFKFTCPEGYDVHEQDADPRTDCTEATDGVTFIVTDEDPDTFDIQTDTGDSQPGAVYFGGLPPGDYTITETLPDDVESAFLWECETDPSQPNGAAHPLNEGEAWDFQMTGVHLECYWYNVPKAGNGTEAAGTETATEEPTGTETATEEPSEDGNSVTVYKWLCPEGTAYGMTIDDYSAACDQEHLNIPITLTDANGDHATTTQANGTQWDDVVPVDGNPDDAVFLAEEIPDGFGEPIVYCQALDQDEWRLYESEDGAFTLDDFGADTPWTVQCNWYNVPGDGVTPLNELLGSININYWECPQGTDFATITDDGLATDCTGTSNGVVFNAISGQYNETQATGELNDSFVGFSEIPTGTLSVKQVTPPLQLIIICEGIVSNGGPETGKSRLPITQATIEWNLLDDEIVYCDWYVIPLAPGFGVVAINKHACPADLDDAYALDMYEMAAQCHEDPGTVNFTVTSGTYDQTVAASGGGNYASFQDVPSGQVTVTEDIPDGYGLPIVFCKVEVELDLTDVVPTYQASVGSGPSIIGSLGSDQLLWCDWYNVPGGYSYVYINKHACGPEDDPYNYDIYEMAANCHEDAGVVEFTVTNGGYSETKPTAGGGGINDVTFPSVPSGAVSVTETLQEGWGTPVVFCKVDLEDGSDVTPYEMMSLTGDAGFTKVLDPGHYLFCDWYNVPYFENTITITKWYCPEGTEYGEDDAWYQDNCTEKLENVDFRLTHSAGENTATTDANGEIVWNDVPLGPFSIQEYIPYEYGEPVVVCGFTAFYDGAVYDGFPQRVEAPGGYFESVLEIPNTKYFCNWYNIPGGPGEVTIYKYTCPEGYDLHAWGANPQDDCSDATNGITYTLDGPGGYSQQSDTGDSVGGAVYFGGLEPGTYTATETVPPDTAYVFVLDCTGGKLGAIRPYPLSSDETLEIVVGAGEQIVCYWYNVPEYDEGRLTVYKYWCSTKTYTSDVDCEIYEAGKQFDLVVWDGDSWEYADTKTTDGGGMIIWGGIEPGEYWLDEHDSDWCHIVSDEMSDDGNWINVYDGKETIVNVYNCSSDPGDKGKPGKTPTKYPNTGTGPSDGGPGAPTELPALAPLAGLLALLFTRRNRQSVGEGPVPSRPNNHGRSAMATSFSRRKLAAILAVPVGGAALIRSGILAQGEQVIEPTEGTPSGTPTSLCLPATPGAEGEEDECLRGPVPVTLKIEAIEVEAPVEILETVGGVMQQPSDEAHVAWYKETARLGELGNLLIAGHLNWWGVPEAVFFNLGTLQEQDRVELLDEEENVFIYEIEWVRQESNLEPPTEEVLGMTPYEAVTLITCGGEWDNSISEYNERTVARAKRVPDEGTPAA